MFGFIPGGESDSASFAVLSQQLIEDDAACAGYVEGVFAAEHGDADVGVGFGGELRGEAFGFVSKQDADGEAGPPVEQVDRVHAGFDGGDLVVPGAEVLYLPQGVRDMFPGDRFLRAEGCFRNHLLGRIARDSSQIEAFEADGVGRAEERAYVIEAADVFEENGRRKRANTGPAGRGFCSAERNSFVTQSKISLLSQRWPSKI